MSTLTLKNINKAFGGIKAVDNVSLTANAGSISTIIGPNGAGKTSLFNIINGFIIQDSGSIFFNNTRVDVLSSIRRVGLGIGRLWQDIRLFKNMTVLENLLVSQKNHTGERIFSNILQREKISMLEKELMKKAEQILAELRLSDKRNILAQNLSYGQQKLVALGRLLMNEAEILLLDEPTAGVHPIMIDEILQTVKQIASTGKTVLMIEHNIPKAFSISDTVYVMDEGKIEINGTPSDVMAMPELKEIYMGV